MEKVFADVMLAKLARWLRLAGVPVQDAPHADDAKLLTYVGKQSGVLLTSDTSLFERAKKRGVRALFIRQERLEKQIALASNGIGVRIRNSPANICPVCNSRLVRIGRERASRAVPEISYKRYRLFYLCRKCRKAYWHGTHWKRIKSRLSIAKRMSERINAR